MNITVYGALTGNGHRSVLNALTENFDALGQPVEADEDFYETVCESNRIMSDFYNLIQKRSMRLLETLSELYLLEGPQQRERQYPMFRQYLARHLPADTDAVVSVTPLINYPIIRYLSETGARTKFYVVVTDPYCTMYPGFEAKGATTYFCPNSISRDQLIQKGVPLTKILVTGYPLRKQFFRTIDQEETRESLSIRESRIICMNCGAGGNAEYLPMITAVVKAVPRTYRFLVICGGNPPLYHLLNEKLSGFENVTIFGFVDHMEELLRVSDVCITKAGANAVYESLATETFPLIVGFNGLAYQEKGVYDFLATEYGISQRMTKTGDLIDFLNRELNEDLLKNFRNRLHRAPVENGGLQIVKSILTDIGEDGRREDRHGV